MKSTGRIITASEQERIRRNSCMTANALGRLIGREPRTIKAWALAQGVEINRQVQCKRTVETAWRIERMVELAGRVA